ncbi:sugar ABC transporter substrate-binding protein [Sphaerisporangium album]|uniref:Sugar ABC transporter substrate-binding protein n=1 Tax=Sphaerisporangium album TaxID=509200 RepID=A0A367FQH5_9ACTN|nr:sugar ABC transporter substrate-binding protein [Sphaerisporangium album]RCG32531.1 sugar ABC transporter substrate-binding protein [Sphaerisporangium album]
MATPLRLTRRRAVPGLAVAALTATAVLSGCASKADSEGAAALQLWTRSTPASAKVYTKVIAEFTKKTGVKVDYVPVYENFEQKIQQAAAAKKLPDVVINDSSLLGPATTQGLVGTIDKASIAGSDQIVDRAWGQATGADGKLHAIPFSTQAMALFIRKDWREKLGKDVPKTWDDLVSLAKAFQAEDPDGNGQADTYGMLVPGSSQRGYTAWWASSFLWEGGGDFLTQAGPGKFTPAIDSPRSVDAVTKLQGLFCKDKVVVPGALTLITDDAHPFFEKGQAGIYLTGPYMMGRFDKSLGKDRYEVVPAPAGPGGATVLGEGENIYLMAGSAQQDGQKKLAEFLISADGQRLGMNGTQPNPVVRIPVNKNVDMLAERKDDRWALIAKVYQESARTFPQVPNWQPFRQKTSETLNSLFATCDADVRGALGKLAADYRTELATQKVAG